MHGLAIVPKGLLRKPLPVTASLGSLRPGVTVGVQRHTFDAESLAPLLELSSAITR
jgi:hypothetical protein